MNMLTEDEKNELIKEAHELLDSIEKHATNLISMLKAVVERKVKE